MMKLPNSEGAFIDLRKLTDCVLNFEDPVGRHKARVFRAALGITTVHAVALKNAILAAVLDSEAEVGEADLYGQRYTVDCIIEAELRKALVRTCWIIRHGEDFPRLTTCYVLKEQRFSK